jgi:hypothetical protein
MKCHILAAGFIAAGFVAADRVYLPQSDGKYYVGKSQFVFNHTTPNDPVAPGPDHTGTFLLTSIFYPTEQNPTKHNTLRYVDPVLGNLTEQGWGLPTGILENIWTYIQVSYRSFCSPAQACSIRVDCLRMNHRH